MVTKDRGIEAIFKEIEDELRSEYSIGFCLQPVMHSGFRSLELTTKRKGLIVQAPDRYYAET